MSKCVAKPTEANPLAGFSSGGFLRTAVLEAMPVYQSTLWRWVGRGTLSARLPQVSLRNASVATKIRGGVNR